MGAAPTEAGEAAPADAAKEEDAATGDAAKEEEAASAEDLQKAAAEADAAPAEVAAQDDGAAETDQRPSLAVYFDRAEQRAKALLEDEEKLMQVALDPAQASKLKEESKEWFEKEAKPLLEKAFKQHDTKNTGVLDKEEAAAFFAHLVHEETDMAKAMSALSIEAGIRLNIALLEGLSDEDRAGLKPQIESQMKEAIKTAKAVVQTKEDKYKADKAAHDAAAFKVLDTSGDGSVQLPEFIAAFEPETPMNINLHIALGYLTQEEVDQQKKMEEQAKEDAKSASQCAQCTQQ